MLYFAYGSNMNEDRMKTRKTNYEFRTGAVLKDYELSFNKKAGYSRASYNSSLYPSATNFKPKKTLWEDKAKYMSTGIAKRKKFCDPEEGYANVMPCEGAVVEGALYVIPETGLKELDRCEGFPTHYGREVLEVTCANGAVVEAVVYIAALDMQEENLLPSDTYLGHLLKGIDVLSEEYFNKLAMQKTVSEFSNKGYSSTRPAYQYDNYDDDYYDYATGGHYPHGNYTGYGTGGTRGVSGRDDYENDDNYWKRKRDKKTITPQLPVRTGV